MRIYVGNLGYDTTEEELREAFSEYGQVASVTVISDRETGQSRGFGFVEMPSQSEGQAAINAMNGRQLGSRELKVNEARPREERGGGGGGGGGRRQGGGGDRGSRDRDRGGRGGRRW